MVNIKVISASDRNNYGDLLFPLIIKKIVEKDYKNYNFENFGVVKYKNYDYGALETKKYKEILKSTSVSQKTKIIIGGGEILGSNWLNILRFLFKFWNIVYHNDRLRVFFNNSCILESYFQTKNKSYLPFVFNTLKNKQTDIFYNSVGGGLPLKKYFQQKPDLINYFKNLGRLSVRDKISYDFFKGNGVNVHLVPDSAIIMSDIFEKELADNFVNKEKQKYAVLQLGKNKAPSDLRLFCKCIKEFAEQFEIKVVLCPIGRAIDHEDDEILHKLCKIEPSFTFFDPKSIYDIMGTIKNATVFLGTSLHGIITAQSFNVPYIAFPEKIKKVELYLKTWYDDYIKHICNFYDCEKMKYILNNYNHTKFENKLNEQKKLVYENISLILK